MSPKEIHDEAASLKANAQSLRDDGMLEQAEQDLRTAISLLRPVIADYEETLLAQEVSATAPSDIREVALLLSDCHGSLGGVLRRQGRLEEALAQYHAGAALESSVQFGITNSYNLVQEVIITVLSHPEAAETASVRERARAALAVVHRQFSGPRRNDPWAYSDYFLLSALLGDAAGVSLAERNMRRLEPLAKFFRSGRPILEQLNDALPQHRGISRALRQFRELERTRPQA